MSDEGIPLKGNRETVGPTPAQGRTAVPRSLLARLGAGVHRHRGLDMVDLDDDDVDGFNAENITKRSWTIADGKYWAVGETRPTLPNDLYEPAYSDSVGHYFKSLTNNLDDIIDLPDSESEKLLKEIEHFTTLKDSFKEHGFLYKRGILLWGPPGSGKTVTIQQLIRLFVAEKNGIAVMCNNPNMLTACLRDLRKVEPERQVLVIIEDIDALIDSEGETPFLNLLDGEAQLQNVVYVATTNYPERLDDRFKDRPSRFDTIRKIDMPSADAREAYLRAKLKDVSDEVLKDYVEGSKGFSVAYLRELIVLTQCFKLDTEEAFKRLNHMRKNSPSSSKSGDGSFGFGN